MVDTCETCWFQRGWLCRQQLPQSLEGLGTYWPNVNKGDWCSYYSLTDPGNPYTKVGPQGPVGPVGPRGAPISKGGFNLPAGVNFYTYVDSSIVSDSLVTFTALNAEAAILLAVHGIYYSIAIDLSLTVFSGDGTNFAGTERLYYGIF